MSIVRRFTKAVAMLALCTAGTVGQETPAAPVLGDKMDSLSYLIGRDIGVQLNALQMQVRTEAFQKGIEHGRAGAQPLIDTVSMDSMRQNFADQTRENMEAVKQESEVEIQQRNEEFLAENLKHQGVMTTNSALQYIILQKGKGARPGPTDSVEVVYKGTLIDNTVVDSTGYGQPAIIDLQNTMKGLSEGIQLMNVGSKYRFFIPSHLTSCPPGAVSVVAPNRTLIFDVELDGILNQ